MTDLTSVDNIKAWLVMDGTSSDDLFVRLVGSVSAFIEGYTGRCFDVQTFDERLDGSGNSWLMIRRWPVVSITSLQFEGQTISPATAGNPPTNGWVLGEPPETGGHQRLDLFGWCFPRGRSNIRLVYEAGYAAVPVDIEQAATEIVGEWYRAKDHIGQVSKVIGNGENITFSQRDMPNRVKTILDRYRSVAPC